MKAKLRLDVAMIKERFRATGLRYQDVEERSGGQITVRQLKYYMNQNCPIDEDTIRLLAEILECEENDLIDKDELLSENIPGDINILLTNLYERKKEDIQVTYKNAITNLMEQWELKKMLQIAHRLFMIFTSDDIDFNRELIVKAMDIVFSTLKESTCISNQRFTGLSKEFSERLIKLIAKINDGDYHPQMIILIFLYVNVIFEAVFLEEIICSAIEIMPQRANQKEQQYFLLAATSEKIRFTLIEKIFNQGYLLEDNKVEELGISDLLVEGVVLMLAACEKCLKHIDGEFIASEYVNRATYDAILNKIIKILSNVSIEMPSPTVFDTFGSRFSIEYNALKFIFKFLNPPKKPRNYHEGYQDGANAIIKGFAINSIMNPLSQGSKGTEN
jgi:transcriptional regulator with XRE-family HTH domain